MDFIVKVCVILWHLQENAAPADIHQSHDVYSAGNQLKNIENEYFKLCACGIPAPSPHSRSETIQRDSRTETVIPEQIRVKCGKVCESLCCSEDPSEESSAQVYFQSDP